MLKKADGIRLKTKSKCDMIIIIDTNIVFSSILNTSSKISQILFDGSKYFNFYSPSYIRTELFEHKDKIKRIGKLTENEFFHLYELVFKNIQVIDYNIIPLETFQTAKILCSDIDIDDTIFVAMSLFFNSPLWTGDLKLMKGLARKTTIM